MVYDRWRVFICEEVQSHEEVDHDANDDSTTNDWSSCPVDNILVDWVNAFTWRFGMPVLDSKFCRMLGAIECYDDCCLARLRTTRICDLGFNLVAESTACSIFQ